jgi:hypothetical protein
LQLTHNCTLDSLGYNFPVSVSEIGTWFGFGIWHLGVEIDVILWVDFSVVSTGAVAFIVLVVVEGTEVVVSGTDLSRDFTSVSYKLRNNWVVYFNHSAAGGGTS